MSDWENMKWREEASCKGIDVTVFIPNEGKGITGRQTYQKARTFCDGCSVVKECLEYALAEGMEFGMFGGKTPRERKDLKRVKIAVG